MPIDKESTANPKTAVTLDQRGGSVFWVAKLGRLAAQPAGLPRQKQIMRVFHNPHSKKLCEEK